MRFTSSPSGNFLRVSIRRPLRLAVISCSAAFIASCDKSVGPFEVLPPLEPSSMEPTAGTWRMILLTGPTQIAVPAPAAVASPAYVAELDAIKLSQANLTPGQRNAVAYWSGGGVMRWNQILRELVARYNLPPAPKDEGGYPVPDAENPFGDPAFPFANPVYAARAYSYVSAAQYDALKSAWYWKFQYNRLSPARNDNTVSALIPLTDLPSYPSEDGVLSGVTVEMLKVLFPAAVQEITLKAAEQRNAALWSGKATASDIAAGLALGKSVATVFLARAAGDGMRTAGGSPVLWKALADSATARGEIAWVSRDIPARPPMLPLFGQVRAWNMTPANIVAERPGPPPSTGSQQMKDETARSQANSRPPDECAAGDRAEVERRCRNVFAAGTLERRRARVRSRRAVQRGAGGAGFRVAQHGDARCRRWVLGGEVPLLQSASFADGSGHQDPDRTSEFPLVHIRPFDFLRAAGASVLSYLFPSGATSFAAMRDEAGISRMYGGIHYRSDIDAGKAHGERIAGYTLTFAQGDGAP